MYDLWTPAHRNPEAGPVRENGRSHRDHTAALPQPLREKPGPLIHVEVSPGCPWECPHMCMNFHAYVPAWTDPVVLAWLIRMGSYPSFRVRQFIEMVNGTDSEVRCLGGRSPKSQDSYPGSPRPFSSPTHKATGPQAYTTGTKQTSPAIWLHHFTVWSGLSGFQSFKGLSSQKVYRYLCSKNQLCLIGPFVMIDLLH